VKAVEQPASPQLATAGEPSGRAVPVSRTARSYWWLQTDWLRHRNTIEDVHPLLVVLQDARGTGFMTIEHVTTVLDSRNPEGQVRQWTEERPSGLPAQPTRTATAWDEPSNELTDPANRTVREAE
jgi:hypothetical protein